MASRDPVNAGTTNTPPLSSTVAASGPVSAASSMTPSPSRSHWIGRAGDEDRAFERVARRCRRPASTPPSSACPRSAPGTSAPTLSSTKLPVPYVFLAMPGSNAGLAEQRRLLVAGDAADRDAGAAPRTDPRSRRSVRSTARPSAGRRPGHVQQLAQLVVPRQLADVEQHRAAGVGGIGGVDLAAGEVPDQPGVDRAEGEVVARRARRRRAAATPTWCR